MVFFGKKALPKNTISLLKNHLDNLVLIILKKSGFTEYSYLL
jgi:hypothetical protein